MRTNLNIFATLFAISLLAPSTALAQMTGGQKAGKPTQSRGPVEMPVDRQMELHRKAAKLPTGPDFSIEVVIGRTLQYSILLTDKDNRSMPGTFVRPQVDIFEALLLAARDFALTEEEVGTVAKPKVTRFSDKNESSFIVDVKKAGVESHFFVTLNSLFGTLTVDAGAIKRTAGKGTKEAASPLFYKIIDRVQEAKAVKPRS